MPLQNELDQSERLRRWKKLAQKRAELLRDSEADNARLRAALEKLVAWADTMAVAHEHPFLNNNAIAQARAALGEGEK